MTILHICPVYFTAETRSLCAALGTLTVDFTHEIGVCPPDGPDAELGARIEAADAVIWHSFQYRGAFLRELPQKRSWMEKSVWHICYRDEIGEKGADTDAAAREECKAAMAGYAVGTDDECRRLRNTYGGGRPIFLAGSPFDTDLALHFERLYQRYEQETDSLLTRAAALDEAAPSANPLFPASSDLASRLGWQRQETRREYHVLIGNGSYLGQKHMDVVQMLSRHMWDRIHIHLPLWGPGTTQAYAKKTADYAERVFTSKCTVYREMPTAAEYLAFLDRMDAAVYSSPVNGAVRDILILCGLGKRVYCADDLRTLPELLPAASVVEPIRLLEKGTIADLAARKPQNRERLDREDILSGVRQFSRFDGWDRVLHFLYVEKRRRDAWAGKDRLKILHICGASQDVAVRALVEQLEQDAPRYAHRLAAVRQINGQTSPGEISGQERKNLFAQMKNADCVVWHGFPWRWKMILSLLAHPGILSRSVWHIAPDDAVGDNYKGRNPLKKIYYHMKAWFKGRFWAITADTADEQYHALYAYGGCRRVFRTGNPEDGEVIRTYEALLTEKAEDALRTKEAETLHTAEDTVQSSRKEAEQDNPPTAQPIEPDVKQASAERRRAAARAVRRRWLRRHGRKVLYTAAVGRTGAVKAVSAEAVGEEAPIEILLGNGRYPELQHMNLLNMFSKYQDQDIRIHIPLWGPNNLLTYALEVEDYARSCFGDKCSFLWRQPSAAEYISLLDRCGAAVFFNLDHYAVRDILLLRYLGKQVYIADAMRKSKHLSLLLSSLGRISQMTKGTLRQLAPVEPDGTPAYRVDGLDRGRVLARLRYLAAGRLYELALVTEAVRRVRNDSTVDVLIGNGNYPEMKHQQLIKMLSRFRNLDIRVHIPLWGENVTPGYAASVESAAKEAFGKKTVIYREQLSPEAYLRLLDRIRTAVFFSPRRQALRDILILRSLGKRVYVADAMRKEWALTPVVNTLGRINDLSKDSFRVFRGIDAPEETELDQRKIADILQLSCRSDGWQRLWECVEAKSMRIPFLHVIPPRQNIITPFMQLCQKRFPAQDHWFLVSNFHREYAPGLVDRPNTVFEAGASKAARLRHLFWMLKQADHVVFHGLYFTRLETLAISRARKVLKKAAWVEWGKDLYDYKVPEQSWKERMLNQAETRIRENLSCYVSIFPPDEREFRKKFKNPAPILQTYYTAFNSIEMLERTRPAEPPKQPHTIQIQIAHSCNVWNNHIQILDALNQFKYEDIRLRIPLSTGAPMENKKTVADYARSLFFDKADIILTELDKEDYFRFLWTIDIAVFALYRQAAMGNIIRLLYMGKKVFLPRGTVMYDFFTEHGVEIYDTESIPNMSFEEFSAPLKGPAPHPFIVSMMHEDDLTAAWEKVFQTLAGKEGEETP